MSNELSFTVVARDQASQTVATVQKKISEFGKDVGRSIAGVLGPMAALQWGIGKVSEYLDDLVKKRKEAFDWGASLSDSAAKLGVTVEQFQNITTAADMSGESVENVAKSFKLAADLIEQAKGGSVDAAKALEAMGINIENIDKVKPQDVLRALAGALQATQDPAQRAQIAIAALGKSAKDLQETLAKGFDIAGALDSMDGLTQEEADFLRGQQREERAKQNKEKLRMAKEGVTTSFLQNDPEGKAILERERQKFRMQMAQAGAPQGGIGTELKPGELATNAAIQTEVQRVLAERERKRREAVAATANPKTAANLTKKAEEDAKKEEDDKKKKEKEAEKPKTPTFKVGKDSTEKPVGVTVSSLREIGGGLAGEMATGADVAFQSLGEQKAMNDTLRRIEARLVPPPTQTNFTTDPRVGGGVQFVPGQFNIGPVNTASRIGVA